MAAADDVQFQLRVDANRVVRMVLLCTCFQCAPDPKKHCAGLCPVSSKLGTIPYEAFGGSRAAGFLYILGICSRCADNQNDETIPALELHCV